MLIFWLYLLLPGLGIGAELLALGLGLGFEGMTAFF